MKSTSESNTHSATYEELMAQHEAAGKYVVVNGIRTFYIDRGSGPIIFCIHGVPSSSFLWRKVIDELAPKGFRVIAIDLPGLGFSDRPENFEYRFSKFSEFCNAFLDSISVERFHLAVHDIGTPVGLYMASLRTDRILSITIMNSMLDLEHFVKPLPMRPFEKPVLGEAELALFTPLTFPLFMRTAGVENMDRITHEEMSVYIHFLKKNDEGKAFLKIMRHFEKEHWFTEACIGAFRNNNYPVQIIWGEKDPLLLFEERGVEFENARPGVKVTKLYAKHFLQEDTYSEIAELIESFISPLTQ